MSEPITDQAAVILLERVAVPLVKPYPRGRHGATYPDMPWEPKAGFDAVAHYYERAGHAEQPAAAQRLPMKGAVPKA
jgi:hypothetical protein